MPSKYLDSLQMVMNDHVDYGSTRAPTVPAVYAKIKWTHAHGTDKSPGSDQFRRAMEFEERVIEKWLEKHQEKYAKAIKHPFILSIRDGTVNLSSFKRWLGQDYLFVREFVPFLASVLLKAWKESDDGSDMEVLLGGMAALNDEISWFKKEASKWEVLLSGVAPQKANQDYCRFLESLIRPEVNYTVAITAFWAIEAVYQESFSLCLQSGSNTPPEVMETCQRWGNEGFGEYCVSLQKIANRNLTKAPAHILLKAEEALLQVLELEVGFWDMSQGET